MPPDFRSSHSESSGGLDSVTQPSPELWETGKRGAFPRRFYRRLFHDSWPSSARTLPASGSPASYADAVDCNPPPDFDLLPGVGQAEEPVLMQALVAKACIEAFHIGILDRLAGLDEVPVYVVLVSPLLDRLADELGSVVGADLPWQAALNFRRSSTRVTRTPPRLVSTSMAGASRL